MNLAFEQRLFKVHSTGQIGDWLITVAANDDGTATMTRRSTKVLGGAPVVTPTIISEGKNIGRANETSPLEQAIAEAKSKVSKQLDKGYVTEEPKAGDIATNAQGLLQPMLAHPIEKVKQWDFPLFVQPKFDGHRMLVSVVDGEVVLYSRQGKPIDVAHIKQELQNLFEQGVWCGKTLDGEIYYHGESLQTISSLVKKPKAGSENLVYHLYDVIDTNAQYIDRLAYLHDLIESTSEKIVVTETILVETQEHFDNLHSQYLADGYEGSIARHGETGYEHGKRSRSLMKRKDFQDAEFKIVDFKLGKPDIKTDATYQRPVFMLETPTGVRFECLAPGTMQERHAIYEQGLHCFIGKQLTVKFFNYTDSGAPFLPVPLRFREDV